MNETVRRLAATCARALPVSADSLDGAPPAFRHALDEIVSALRSDPRFMFDAEGRPGATAAVREALPPAEAELLDAIREDVAAELAANREALFQVLLACQAGRT